LSEPPQAMTEGEAYPAFFVLLELDVEAPSYYNIYGNEGQTWVELWLVHNKCGKIMTWGFRQGKADCGLDM
jgi:hypothetical protein